MMTSAAKAQPELYNFMNQNQYIFISVLDQIKNNHSLIKDQILYTPFKEQGKINSLLVQNRGNFYVKTNENNILPILTIINDSHRLFSIYGENTLINSFIEQAFRRYRTLVQYYIMELSQQDFVYEKIHLEGFTCQSCNEKHYTLLKELQYLYHREEVYASADYYPYEVEMRQFKGILKKRLNYAVFTKQKPQLAASKVYVNAESDDTYQIGGVYTLKTYRRQGLSYYCLNEFCKAAFQQKKRRVMLFVNRDNQKAINLYLKMGFKKYWATATLYF
ncbi:MAG: GNAT family N-acetyltransferase [Spirochaetes bacterium]|nr:GNAT family N-acetyltransferase [Spirochaetota bacterium]